MALVQMTSQTLNALKGWPHQHALDFHANFAPTVLANDAVVPKGAVVHLNDNLQYELGVGSLKVMPLFTFYSSRDVSNNGGNPATDKNVYIAGQPQGKMLALPAKGAFELVNTNFVAGSYPPNTLLTSPTSTANAGKLTSGTYGTDTICGIVSRGIVNNGYGHNAVAYWPIVMFP